MQPIRRSSNASWGQQSQDSAETAPAHKLQHALPTVLPQCAFPSLPRAGFRCARLPVIIWSWQLKSLASPLASPVLFLPSLSPAPSKAYCSCGAPKKTQLVIARSHRRPFDGAQDKPSNLAGRAERHPRLPRPSFVRPRNDSPACVSLTNFRDGTLETEWPQAKPETGGKE